MRVDSNSLRLLSVVFDPRQFLSSKQSRSNALHTFFFVLIGIFVLISCPNFVLATEPLSSLTSKPQSEQLELEPIQTILVTGTVKSWLKGGTPHYAVIVTLKLRLQDAGFTVVFDPALPHDANLRIQYEEYPSGQFQVLEQATALTYSLQLVHTHLGEIFSRDFTAKPNPIPVGSLYWDTISNLEENPYYYFFGDILWAHLQHDMNEQVALLEILMKPYRHPNATTTSDSRSMNEAAILKHARINAIKELGKGSFDTPQARETLWKLAKKAHPNERHEAVTQLGIIGDHSMLADLTELMEKEVEPEVQSATQHAIRLIESR